MIKKILFIAIVGTLSACSGDIYATKTAKGYFEPTNPADVTVGRTVPKGDFVELGTFTVTGYEPDEDAELHNALREKAANLGASHVIITEEGIVTDGWGGLDKWASAVALLVQKPKTE